MKLSLLLEYAQHIINKSKKPLNEGYKSSMVRSICKKIDDQLVFNTLYWRGNQLRTNEMGMEDTEKLYFDYDCQGRMSNYFEKIFSQAIPDAISTDYYNKNSKSAAIGVRAFVDLVTNRDLFMREVMQVDPDSCNHDTYVNVIANLKAHSVNFSKMIRTLDGLESFRLSDVEDKYVEIITPELSRKVQYSKGVIFWYDQDDNIIFISHKNQVIFGIEPDPAYSMDLFILDPANFPDTVDSDFQKNISAKIAESAELRWFNIPRYLTDETVRYFRSIGILHNWARPTILEDKKSVKNRYDSTSTKSIILDNGYILSKISKVVCITAEGFELNNHKENDLQRAKYKDFLIQDAVQIADKKKLWKKLVSKAKTVNEYRNTVDAIEEFFEKSFDLSLALKDLGTLAQKQKWTEQKLPEHIFQRIENANNVLAIMVNNCMRILDNIISLKDVTIKSMRDDKGHAVSEVISEVMSFARNTSNNYMTMVSSFRRLDVIFNEWNASDELRQLLTEIRGMIGTDFDTSPLTAGLAKLRSMDDM